MVIATERTITADRSFGVGKPGIDSGIDTVVRLIDWRGIFQAILGTATFVLTVPLWFVAAAV